MCYAIIKWVTIKKKGYSPRSVYIKKRNCYTAVKFLVQKTTMKYSKEGSRVFVPYQYDEITTENIKEACKTFFCDHHLLIF